jgi:SynChlorMet cassette protein ScmA
VSKEISLVCFIKSKRGILVKKGKKERLQWMKPILKSLGSLVSRGTCVGGSTNQPLCDVGGVANACGGGAGAGVPPP